MHPTNTNADLERRVLALEVKLIQVASHADLAWEAEQARRKASHDFWWTAYRLVAVATAVAAWGLLLLRLAR